MVNDINKDGWQGEDGQAVPEREQLEGAVGLGMDIVEIERMARILQRTPRFRVRVFTEDERAYCDSKAKPAVHYACRFAAKEAVLKALGTGFSKGIAPADVEVARNAQGRPYAVLHRKALEESKRQGVIDLPLSLSYTHSDAVACAMAITADSVRAAEERVNPMEELAAQFKEARALLDDLPEQGIGEERRAELEELKATLPPEVFAEPAAEEPTEEPAAEEPVEEGPAAEELAEEGPVEGASAEGPAADAQDGEAADSAEADGGEA